MTFLETVASAKTYLREHGRISLSALKLEFDLDDARLEFLIEELVDVQQVAACEGKVLSWIGAAPGEPGGPPSGKRATPDASSEPAAAPQAPEAERRQLTVLFCDLVDSSRLAARLDPEDWREVVRGYQQRAAALVERFDGYVAQYLGDGLLVYFGWPHAHEDDAERAVRTGLGILDAIGAGDAPLAVRIGIHTGPVVVGEMGGGANRETLAMGDTTNVAARLQTEADPGSVVLSSATLRLVPGVFLTEALGELPLKGIGRAVAAHRALRASGVRSRLDVDPSRLTPLVGRDMELGLLLERWEQVQEGEGQTVLITGEPGVGKSRLVHALRQQLAAESNGWLECRGTPYTQGSVFHPLIELLEQELGFKEGGDPESKLTRLEGGVAAAHLSAHEVVPLIAPFLLLPLPDRYPELELSPELQRKKTIEALVSWIFGLAEQQPLVMLVEDLHWCDPSTVELLGRLVEQSPTAKMLTLLSFRPSFEPPWPPRSHATPLRVTRLSHRQATKLIGGMTRGVPLPDELLECVVTRGDGIPLFLEELTKTVLESGLVEEREGRYELTRQITDLAIPTTLHDSLMARLDRLDAGKEVAQLGAVLGREFSYELLRSVSLLEEPHLRAGLAELVDAELLYQRSTPPGATYTFKHALLCDAAYQSLLHATRRRHHYAVAETLIDRMTELAEARPELVAHHLTEATAFERAIAYWQRAGDRANAQVAHEEAIRHLRRGLELLTRLAEGTRQDSLEIGLQMALGQSLMAARGWAHPDTRRAWDRARVLCDPGADPLRAARIYFGLGTGHTSAGDSRAALEACSQLIHIGTYAGEKFRVAGDYGTGITLWYLGRFRESRDHLEEVITRYDPGQLRDLLSDIATDMLIGAHPYAALCYWTLGFSDQAWRTATDAVEHARRIRHPFILASALAWAGMLAALRREWAPAETLGAEVEQLGAGRGFPVFEAAGGLLQAMASGAQGDPGAAHAYAAAIARSAGTGNQALAPLMIGNLVELQMTGGHLEEAAASVEGAIGIASQTGQSFYDAALYRLKGEIFLQREGHLDDEAEALFCKAIDISRSQEAKSLELRAATSLARYWQRQGRKAEARDLLALVYDWFTEGFDTEDLKDAKALLEQLR